MDFSLGELAVKFGCDLVGDPKTRISFSSTLISAKQGDLSFYSNVFYLKQLESTAASAVVIKPSDLKHCPVDALLTDDPHIIFSKIVALLNPLPTFEPNIDASASISEKAIIPNSAFVGALCFIGDGVKIGENVYIGPGCIIDGHIKIGSNSRLIANVTVVNKVAIGKETMIHPGSVIGSDGFGNMKTEKGWLKIHQIGGVKIGNDVEIGSNTTIDRGSLDDTEIHDGVRLDNQIQIGHNVCIGEHTAVAASAAIAGSAIIGKRCMIAGQVGLVGHIEICDDVRINGGSVVTKSIKKSGVYSGSFAADEDKVWKKLVAKIRRL